MAVTSTQNNPGTLLQMATGNYLEDDTAVAFDITTGFKPRYVRVVNETSRDMLEWFEGMADAEAIKTVAAGTRTLITSLGISILSGNNGFTVGLDLDVNVVNEQLSWVAFG